MKDQSITERTLITDAHVYAPDHPDATAVLFSGNGIEWIGCSSDAPEPDRATKHVHADGRLLTPGFVDAHVHATNTGLMLTGLDVLGVGSAEGLLEQIADFAAQHPGEMIIGHGWDETRWTDAAPPTVDEIDRAARGSAVYLSRVDVHSALISSRVRDAVPDLAMLPGFAPETPVVSRQAHGAARTHVLSHVDPSTRARAQRAFLTRAAENGIVAVHEMAGPTISGEDDARALMDMAHTGVGPRVFVYWGELASHGGIERARSLGAIGAGGDLFLDGALGSRTAALHDPYTDAMTTTGALYVSYDETLDHLIRCSEIGLQAGFHVIGDRACDTVVDAMVAAAARVGIDRFRSLRHRLEHAEMLSDAAIGRLASLNVIVSMQPAFDELWSGPGGMYEQRLGPDRAWAMNRWGSVARAGAAVVFSSDSPVTAMSPWVQIRAAASHHDPAERMSTVDAMEAHSRAGWEAAGDRGSGRILPGLRADLALWDIADGLPALSEGTPACVATWVAGAMVFASESLP